MDRHFEPGSVLLAESWPAQRMRSLMAGFCLNICFVLLIALLRPVTPSEESARPPAHIFLAASDEFHKTPRAPTSRIHLVRTPSEPPKAKDFPLIEAPEVLSIAPPPPIDGLIASITPHVSAPKVQPLLGSFPKVSTTPSTKPVSSTMATPPSNFSDATPAAPDPRTVAGATIQTSAFSAASASPALRVSTPPVASAGFDKPSYLAVVPHGSSAPSQPSATKAVEILVKPRPQYSEEARKLKIEGEVWLEILFRCDGTVMVQRVLRGLGHGLDENASRAAAEIRFRPAEQDGRTIDQLAVVHVQFQLAD